MSDISKLRAELRRAVADYMRHIGCGCCGDYEMRCAAEENLGKLLNVPKYSDGSGRDFGKYESNQPTESKGK